MTISYDLEPGMPLEEFRGILKSSGLWERRPYNEPERLERMLRNASIIVAARSSSTGAIAAMTTCGSKSFASHTPLFNLRTSGTGQHTPASEPDTRNASTSH